ncbi:hypothetical protein BJX70DRAFT_127961 [Aspergillus crustosus]
MNYNHIFDASSSLEKGENARQPCMPSFVSGDQISGVFSVCPKSDMTFSNLHIFLIGEESTSMRTGALERAHHQFLQLEQPLLPTELPNPRVLKKGAKYKFPFAFTVPDYLPNSVCLHPSSNPSLRAAHLDLPPSFGGNTTGFGRKPRNDYASPKVEVGYTIQGRTQWISPLSGDQETILSTTLRVRITPVLDVTPLPGFGLGPLNEEFAAQREETFYSKKSKLSLGRLTVTLDDPDCLWLPTPDSGVRGTIDVTIKLQYIPINLRSTHISHIPAISSLKGHLAVTTIFTTTITEESTAPAKRRSFFRQPQNYHEKKLPLPIPSSVALSWTRDSEDSYTSTLSIPVSLPNENLVPTFHSCLISRIYNLGFQVCLSQTDTVPVKVKVSAPIKIAAKREQGALPSYDAVTRLGHMS